MRERPIILKAHEVRAIRSGLQTQLRRTVRNRHVPLVSAGRATWSAPMPYGQPGDRLWVRETWCDVHPLQVADGRYSQPGRAGIPGPPSVDFRTIYRADGEYPPIYHLGGEPWPFRSLDAFERDGIHAFEEKPYWDRSVHMPRWASRITLEVTDVRVERLQAISEADALAEGVDPAGPVGYIPASDRMGRCRYQYANLWESINGAGSWDANPWVWVVSFTRIEA